MNGDLIAFDPNLGREELENLLTERIETMLRHDFAALIQALYRVDVPENIAAQAFQAPTISETARLLAQAVIRRRLQQIESRKKYARADANRTYEPNENPPDDATNSPS